MHPLFVPAVQLAAGAIEWSSFLLCRRCSGAIIFSTGNRQFLKAIFGAKAHGPWGIPAVRSLPEEMAAKNARPQGYRVEHDLPGIGRKTVSLDVCRIDQDDEPAALILVAFKEVVDEPTP